MAGLGHMNGVPAGLYCITPEEEQNRTEQGQSPGGVPGEASNTAPQQGWHTMLHPKPMLDKATARITDGLQAEFVGKRQTLVYSMAWCRTLQQRVLVQNKCLVY